MKKVIGVVLSLLFIFILTGISIAAEKKGVSKHVTGDVTAVDLNAKTITVKGKTGDIVISVDDKTKITAGKEAKTLADIKVGDKVTVNYTEAEGKNTAKSIDIHVTPTKKK